MLEILCDAIMILELAGILVIGILVLNAVLRMDKKIDIRRHSEPVIQMSESRVSREAGNTIPEPVTVNKVRGTVICRKCYSSFPAGQKQCPNCGTVRSE